MKHYQDFLVRLLVSVLWAHFIKALGYSESLFEMFLEQGYFAELFFGVLVTLLIWEGIRQATIWLEHRYDWLEQTFMRTILQIALGIVLPAFLLFFVMSLYFQYVYGENILETSWLRIEYRVCVLFMIGLNAAYLLQYFYRRFRHAEAQLTLANAPAPSAPAHVLPEVPSTAVQTLIAVKGARNIPIAVERIAYCFLQSEQYFLCTVEGERFMISYTLDEVESLLPASSFFRLNRQIVAHWKACAAFKSIAHGKLEVLLKPEHSAPVIVSQKKAALFKSWLVSR